MWSLLGLYIFLLFAQNGVLRPNRIKNGQVIWALEAQIRTGHRQEKTSAFNADGRLL